MFDLEQFIAVAGSGAVLKGLGEPAKAGVSALYRGEDLTILNVVWAPLMTIMPHDHRTWAVIGIYTGAEDNMYWRRVGENRVEAAGACSLRVGDAEALGRDIIHSVTNPIPRLTAAIHVYRRDFMAIARSEWDPETLLERPYDGDKNYRAFAEAEARFARA
jgi:predicted metal-dependent enzyme (double-stranded beta helix superfamily)